MDHLENHNKDKISKVFKAGNSEAIRLTKKGAELLDLNPGDQVIKEISPDGMSIKYKKIPKISQETKKEITNILDEDADLILALRDV